MIVVCNLLVYKYKDDTLQDDITCGGYKCNMDVSVSCWNDVFSVQCYQLDSKSAVTLPQGPTGSAPGHSLAATSLFVSVVLPSASSRTHTSKFFPSSSLNVELSSV
eukprot:4905530-Pleurochrysis_carterae.AAC.1